MQTTSTMGLAAKLLIVVSLLYVFVLQPAVAQSFRCSTTAVCKALAGYVPVNATKISDIQSLFSVKKLRSLLDANNLPLSTPRSFTVPAGHAFKVPIPCLCRNNTGVSNMLPVYRAKKDDAMYYIASTIFSGLLAYERILEVNGISDAPDPFRFYVGMLLWIPIPCSCDDVNGEKVVHYTHVVEQGSSVEQIAQTFGTDQQTLFQLNGIANDSQLMANIPFDVPLRDNCRDCDRIGGCCCFNNNGSVCFCRDGSYRKSCSYGSKHGINWKLRLLVGGASAIVGLLILSSLAWKMSIQVRKSFGWVRDPEIEAFIRNHATLSPKRYRYSEVKGIASSFKHKLGQGGYGGVYEGKLEDGRLVAVKVLNTSKGDGKDFINEVASISRTCHVNVVTLLGFCLERKTRALIYEFMPNGSLDKFIFKRNDLNQHLGWNKLYDIALGIARGLEYLHQGCNTRIVHFDIKPHNILLDKNFNPKISDFGLAKLCTRNESILSMMEARGTIGYIAPEVFSRNFGVVSHKSDVYSYGMMLLEMAGGRRNLDVQVSQTSEVYFPHLVYRHLEQGTQLKLQGLIGNEETEIVRKMIVVGLWCIQPSPSDRPSISKVIEMFEGSVEALQNPPNPFLSSPPRILQESTSAVSS